MGLYAIAIRDSRAASEIPAILRRHGYDVHLKNEDDAASFFTCPITRGKLLFSISKGTPQRFSIGVVREGTAIVRTLEKHGVFDVSAEAGDASAG